MEESQDSFAFQFRLAKPKDVENILEKISNAIVGK